MRGPNPESMNKRSGGVAQSTERMSSGHGALGSNPCPTSISLGVVSTHRRQRQEIRSPSATEEVQDQPRPPETLSKERGGKPESGKAVWHTALPNILEAKTRTAVSSGPAWATW